MPVASSIPAPAAERARPRELADQFAEDPRCDVCPHPVADHDGISLRFCRATIASAVVRGCVCRPA